MYFSFSQNVYIVYSKTKVNQIYSFVSTIVFGSFPIMRLFFSHFNIKFIFINMSNILVLDIFNALH